MPAYLALQRFSALHKGDNMETVSPDWFIWRALVGIIVGYGLRVFEHIVWSWMQKDAPSTSGFAIMILPPALIIGTTLGYVSVILLATVIKDGTALSFLAYLLSAFWAFLSLDIRSLLRRH